MINFPQLIKPDTWLANAWLMAKKYPIQTYIGRFAPSPSGLLHQGSLITALASYIHAHWHKGQWLVRMEDIDTSRCTRDYGLIQLDTLRQLGFVFDESVMWQTERNTAYQNAFDQLKLMQCIYPCACTRQDLNLQKMHDFAICMEHLRANKPIRSWRFQVNDTPIVWFDNELEKREILTDSIGDFVIHRLPNEWTYQLAVIVDDAEQNVTHIVRGEDLLDSTARQIALQNALGYLRPIYHHVPLLLNNDGTKLSKSEQSPALSMLDGLNSLQHAWQFLGGQPFIATTIAHFWQTVLMPRI